MGTVDQKLSNYVWDNLSELESIFSERVYRILSRFRAKDDREGFSDTLGLVLESDKGVLKKIESESEDIENIFGAKLITSRKVLYQAEQGFNSTLPLCNDELMIAFNMNSSPIASSFPFISSELSSDNGVLYGINRHNNSLCNSFSIRL